jgi:hypothetical protein
VIVIPTYPNNIPNRIDNEQWLEPLEGSPEKSRQCHKKDSKQTKQVGRLPFESTSAS